MACLPKEPSVLSVGLLPRPILLNWASNTEVAGGNILPLILLRILDTLLKHLFFLI